MSYRQEQTGASVLANGAGYPPEAANNVGRLPVEHPDMPEFPLHQHEILNRPASLTLMAALLAQFCGGKFTLKVENFSKLIQNARDVVGWSYESWEASLSPYWIKAMLLTVFTTTSLVLLLPKVIRELFRSQLPEKTAPFTASQSLHPSKWFVLSGTQEKTR
ncbi:unnamed protein product [Porites evermanni]|uniref:Uncharacterized protein n=1 Tax=Porites evermanni TaxID=104178 RepID=A0ABN8QUD4_9CNID|nr:unnamed protein product [Porites evermanni]